MQAKQRRYIARAPRYTFRPEDQGFLRFANMDTRGLTWHGAIRDLSETGLSFFLGEATAPEEGQMVKLEFSVPGRRQIACFATVMRVDEQKEWDAEWGGERVNKIVGVQFRHLPIAHRRAIQKGISGRVSPEEESDYTNSRQAQAVAFGISSFAMFCSFILLVQPFSTWLSPFKAWF